MATIKKFKVSKYQYLDFFKLSDTAISNDVKKMERYTGTVLQQGDTIKAEDHNEIQKNGVIFSKPVYSFEGQINNYTLSDFTLEQEIFEGLKLKLLIDTDSVSDTCTIKINEIIYPVNEKFKAGNLYNLVYVNDQFMVEKNGGDSSGGVVTIVDQDTSITVPERQSYDTGINVPDGNYSLINIILTFENFLPSKKGISAAYELVKVDFSQTGFIEGGAYRCGPYETFEDGRIFAWIQNNTLWLQQVYMNDKIKHIKIQVI